MTSQIRFVFIPLLLVALPIYPTFFGEELVPFLIAILVLATLFESKKITNLKARFKLLLPYLFAVSVYLLYTILSPDIKIALKILERQTSLIVVPFLIMLCDWPKKRMLIFCKGFVFTLIVISLFSVFLLVKFGTENSEWIQVITKTGTSKVLYLQYKYPHILNTHPTYWSYLILGAILIVNMFLLNDKGFKKGWLIAAFIVLSANLLYLAGRTPILIYLVTQSYFFSCLLRMVKGRKLNIKTYMLIFSGLIFAIFVLFNAPLFKKKTQIVLDDERTYYWPLALSTIQNNSFLLGEGLGQANEVIKRHIIDKGDDRVRYRAYDLHNQYLRHYVDMGILGFISLLWIGGASAKFISRNNKEIRFATSSFLILFFLAMVTESYLIRLKGILFFTVVSSLLLVINHSYHTLRRP